MSFRHPRLHLRHASLPAREAPPRATAVDDEPTLEALLQRLTRTSSAERFYEAIQLALPFAGWFAWLGWFDPAGACCTVGLFGVWGALKAKERDGALTGWRRWVARGAATGAIVLAVLVALDIFRRLLGAAPNH